MGAGQVFEDAAKQASAVLQDLRHEAEGLVKAVAQAADLARLPGRPTIADLADRNEGYGRLQQAAHDRLALIVEDLAAAVEDDRLQFEKRGMPSPLDRVIGRLSARVMRMRVERRSRRAVHLGPLRLVLGRVDRIYGIIQPHRDALMAHRDAAERAYSLFAERHRPVLEGRDEGVVAGNRRKEALAVISASRVLGGAVDLLNEGVRDNNVLLHKLTFDAEHLLHLYAVLLEMGAGASSDGELAAESYPRFYLALRRFAKGYLPGRRVVARKRLADAAFNKRYQQALDAH